jgi:periplasmic copper chaperone A
MRSQAVQRCCVALAVALIVTGCVPFSSGITVQNPWSRQAMDGNNGAAFMMLTNNSTQDDRLVSATASIAERVELHETIDDNGVMRMVHQPDGFPLPIGATLELKPGGKHIMLIGLNKMLKPGDIYSLTLNFEKADPITLEVSVKAP